MWAKIYTYSFSNANNCNSWWMLLFEWLLVQWFLKSCIGNRTICWVQSYRVCTLRCALQTKEQCRKSRALLISPQAARKANTLVEKSLSNRIQKRTPIFSQTVGAKEALECANKRRSTLITWASSYTLSECASALARAAYKTHAGIRLLMSRQLSL